MLNEEQIRSLRKIENRTDKEHALYFVGRQDIIAGIENTVAELQESITGRTAAELFAADAPLSDQRTWLVQGAPGAGKTALQTHLRQIWGQRENGPNAIQVSIRDLKDESVLTHKIADRISHQGAALLTQVRNLELSGQLTLVGGGITVKTDRSKRSETLCLGDLWRLYDRGLWARIRAYLPDQYRSEASVLRPVVLLFDEIQKLHPQGEELLLDLHLGSHGLPMVAMLVGLAWSRVRLKEAGLSRFSDGHVRTLAPLAEPEAADAVHRLLQDHHIKGYQDVDIAGKIARWSNGWPQHLQNYIGALAGEVADRKGDLTQLDETRIRRKGDLARKNYYQECLTDSRIRACENLLAEVAEVIGEHGVSESELLYLLRGRAWDNHRHPADTMPQNMVPQEFIDQMIKNGMVHSEDAHITIPIPSFRMHLINRRVNV